MNNTPAPKLSKDTPTIELFENFYLTDIMEKLGIHETEKRIDAMIVELKAHQQPAAPTPAPTIATAEPTQDEKALVMRLIAATTLRDSSRDISASVKYADWLPLIRQHVAQETAAQSALIAKLREGLWIIASQSPDPMGRATNEQVAEDYLATTPESAASELAELRKADHEHRSFCAEVYLAIGTTEADRSAWLGIIRELRKDKERLDWLDEYGQLAVLAHRGFSRPAIDAARQQQEGGK